MKRTLYVLMTMVLAAALLFAVGCGKEQEKEPTEADVPTASNAPTEGSEETSLPEQDYQDPDGLTKEEFDAMTVGDLLAKIADRDNVTAEEYIALVSTLRFAEIEDPEGDAGYVMDKGITGDAINTLDYSAKPEVADIMDALLSSPHPQVRAQAYCELNRVAANTDVFEAAMERLAEEQEPFVQWTAMAEVGSYLSRKAGLRDVTYQLTGSDNYKVRAKAALIIGSMTNQEDPDAAAKLNEMMKDENPVVSKAACSAAGTSMKGEVIDSLVEILNDPSKSDLHGTCAKSLTEMWNGWFYNNKGADESTRERAFNATMEYYAKTPRTQDVPSAEGILAFNMKSDKYEEWKQTASYFDEDRLYNVMLDLVKDPDADWIARTNALEAIKYRCSDSAFTGLKSVIDGLNDEKASFIQYSYEDLLKK